MTDKQFFETISKLSKAFDGEKKRDAFDCFGYMIQISLAVKDKENFEKLKAAK